MHTLVIDGLALARRRETLLKERVTQFTRRRGRKPKLLAVKLSDDPGSALYLKLKRAAAARLGIEMSIAVYDLPTGYRKLGRMDTDGIFVQHPPRTELRQIIIGLNRAQREPLASEVDEFWLDFVDWIPVGKDVDCLTRANLELINQGAPRFLPATVKAIGYCLAAVGRTRRRRGAGKAFGGQAWHESRGLNLNVNGKRVVVLGRSVIVGWPLSWWLSSLGADVSVLDSTVTSHELHATCRAADILIATTGRPGLVTAEMVKPGAIVVDAGAPKGDVRFDEVLPKVTAITPVPGGVGPLTVVSLMENVVEAAFRRLEAHVSWVARPA